MTKLIGDDRECAQAVNEILSQRNRSAPKLKNETRYINQTLIFGHYDSRGGAMLITQAASIIEGMTYYNQSCGWEPNDDCAYEDLKEGSEGWLELVVVGDGRFEGELLAGYDGDFVLFRLQRRWYSTHSESWNEWETAPVAALVTINDEQKELDDFSGLAPEIEEAPKSGFFTYEYRWEIWECGEDACGLCLID